MKYVLYGYLFFTFAVQAAPECVERSWHLAKKDDPKVYHPADCSCPCGSYSSNDRYKIIAQRGICVECGHCRFFRPSFAVGYTQKKAILLMQSSTVHPDGAQLHALFKKIDISQAN